MIDVRVGVDGRHDAQIELGDAREDELRIPTGIDDDAGLGDGVPDNGAVAAEGPDREGLDDEGGRHGRASYRSSRFPLPSPVECKIAAMRGRDPRDPAAIYVVLVPLGTKG